MVEDGEREVEHNGWKIKFVKKTTEEPFRRTIQVKELENENNIEINSEDFHQVILVFLFSFLINHD